MPDSDSSHISNAITKPNTPSQVLDWKPFFRATGHLTVLLALLWGMGYIVAHNSLLLTAYRIPFSWGHRFPGQMSRVKIGFNKKCLIIGTSSVREGFDEETMNAVCPDLTFINAATAGSSLYYLEPQTSLLLQYHTKSDVIVIGLHPFMLRDQALKLDGDGYTDFMDLTHSADLLDLPNDPDERQRCRRTAIINTIWPMHRPSRQISRIIRAAEYVVRRAIKPSTSRRFFEIMPGELTIKKQYYITPVRRTSKQLAAKWRKYKKAGRLDSANYGHPEHYKMLRRILDACIASSKNVVIVIMPEDKKLRERCSVFVRKPLLNILREYKEKGCLVLDFHTLLNDDEFIDTAHALPKGRLKLSKAVSEKIHDAIRSPSH